MGGNTFLSFSYMITIIISSSNLRENRNKVENMMEMLIEIVVADVEMEESLFQVRRRNNSEVGEKEFLFS